MAFVVLELVMIKMVWLFWWCREWSRLSSCRRWPRSCRPSISRNRSSSTTWIATTRGRLPSGSTRRPRPSSERAPPRGSRSPSRTTSTRSSHGTSRSGTRPRRRWGRRRIRPWRSRVPQSRPSTRGLTRLPRPWRGGRAGISTRVGRDSSPPRRCRRGLRNWTSTRRWSGARGPRTLRSSSHLRCSSEGSLNLAGSRNPESRSPRFWSSTGGRTMRWSIDRRWGLHSVASSRSCRPSSGATVTYRCRKGFEVF